MPNRLPYYQLLIVFLFHPILVEASSRTAKIVHKHQIITITYPASFNQNERDTTYKWLMEVTRAARTVYGELPRDKFTLTIRRSQNPSGPVPWGQIKRADPPAMLLVINPEFGYDALLRDWTAFHEIAHLLIPYNGYGGAWFSEGLASYYQNIIQARSGLLTEIQMWKKITTGLTRGKKQQTYKHQELAKVSDAMSKNRQFMRVHWSGVLYWLKADVELRKQNKDNLDKLLKQLKDCCQKSSMSAKAIAIKLDALANAEIFVPLFEKFSNSHQLPEYESLLKNLGITEIKEGGEIKLQRNAMLANIRQDIYQPQAPAAIAPLRH